MPPPLSMVSNVDHLTRPGCGPAGNTCDAAIRRSEAMLPYHWALLVQHLLLLKSQVNKHWCNVYQQNLMQSDLNWRKPHTTDLRNEDLRVTKIEWNSNLHTIFAFDTFCFPKSRDPNNLRHPERISTSGNASQTNQDFHAWCPSNSGNPYLADQ